MSWKTPNLPHFSPAKVLHRGLLFHAAWEMAWDYAEVFILTSVQQTVEDQTENNVHSYEFHNLTIMQKLLRLHDTNTAHTIVWRETRPCLSTQYRVKVPQVFWTSHSHSRVFLATLNFYISTELTLILSDNKVHLRTAVRCLELTMMWRGRAAHNDRKLTTVFTAQRLHFQMTADNCFTWPWPLRPAGWDLTCQVWFTGII